MEIWRQGANRKTGWSVIKSRKAAQFGFADTEKKGSVVEITLRGTADPSQVGEYDHVVRLSFADVGMLIDELADISDAKRRAELAEVLANYVRPLSRLAALGSGIGLV